MNKEAATEDISAKSMGGVVASVSLDMHSWIERVNFVRVNQVLTLLLCLLVGVAAWTIYKKMGTDSNSALRPILGQELVSVPNYKTPGGIDFNPDKMDLQIKGNDNAGIKFHLDPVLLRQLQNAPGFVPVITNIQPLKSLSIFLEIARPSVILSEAKNLKEN